MAICIVSAMESGLRIAAIASSVKAPARGTAEEPEDT